MPGRDRTRRDEHDLGAAAVRGGEGVDEGRDLAGVLAADRRRADLDDDARRRGDLGSAARRHCSPRLGHSSASTRGVGLGDIGVVLGPDARLALALRVRRGPRPWRPCARGSRSRRSARVARRFSSRRSVGAARRGDELGRRGERGLPVEHDARALADDDGRAGDGARANELVLDAELARAGRRGSRPPRRS